MFKVQPQAVACDLHPDYLSSRYAKHSGLPLIQVQHHHAHFASVLAEHNLDDPALGLIFDGSGYGLDGNLWGGEILYGGRCNFKRLAHLSYLPLAGAEVAIREPWRQALSALYSAGGENLATNSNWQWPKGWEVVLDALIKKINTPLSSGMGRLFDAVAAMNGLYHLASYEGQAAIALEHNIDNSVSGSYCFNIYERREGPWELDWRPVIREAAQDILAGESVGTVATRFHSAVAEMCLNIACRLRRQLELNTVALSGGCWQNIWLLTQVYQSLSAAGFKVYTNSAVPANDGGLAFGQAAVASQRSEVEEQRLKNRG
jgi:hydrogenase maturation protein HypF